MRGEGNKGDLQTLIGNHLDRMSASITDPMGDSASIDQELMWLDDLAHAALWNDDQFLKEWEGIKSKMQEQANDPQEDPDLLHRRQRHLQSRCIIKHLYLNNVLRKAPLDVEDVGEILA